MRTRSVTIVFDGPLLETLEEIESKVLSKDPKIDIPSYIKSCLEVIHEDTRGGFPGYINTSELSEIIRMEAYDIYKEAKIQDKSGDLEASRSSFLKSASLELEALALSDEQSEDKILSFVMLALCRIKMGLKYKRLPEV